MSNYHGDIRLGDTIDVKFTSRAFATGAPTTLSGSPVISAYVGNGTTEITAGITLSVDFDSRTGLNNVRVVATSGNGYATATNVELVITTGTVGGVSVVGECVGAFSIEARSAVMPVTAGQTLAVSSAGGVTLADGVAHGGTPGASTASLALTRVNVASLSANIPAVQLTGNGTGAGLSLIGGATASGLRVQSGATSGDAVHISAFASGNGVRIDGTGTSMHGVVITGGSAGTSDALKLVASSGVGLRSDSLTVTGATTLTGAVTATNGSNDIRGVVLSGTQTFNLTGNITGNLSGSVGSVTGAVGSVTAPVTVGTNNDKTGYVLSATGSAVLTEGYRANGAAGTLNQLLYEIVAHMGEAAIAGTVKTINHLDHTTPAETFNLDSATDPSSITRAS